MHNAPRKKTKLIGITLKLNAIQAIKPDLAKFSKDNGALITGKHIATLCRKQDIDASTTIKALVSNRLVTQVGNGRSAIKNSYMITREIS